ncbi:hypothetical protein [Azospirillum doebereinerae]
MAGLAPAIFFSGLVAAGIVEFRRRFAPTLTSSAGRGRGLPLNADKHPTSSPAQRGRNEVGATGAAPRRKPLTEPTVR